MYISRFTDPLEIINTHVPPLLRQNQKQAFADDIRRYAEVMHEGLAMEEFQERLQKQSKDPSQNWSLHSQDKQLLNDIADRLPAEAKAKLMRLSLEDICELKNKWERAVYKELLELVKSKIIDREFGEPILWDSFFETFDKPSSKERFIKLLNEQKISVARCKKMIDILNEEYMVREVDDADDDMSEVIDEMMGTHTQPNNRGYKVNEHKVCINATKVVVWDAKKLFLSYSYAEHNSQWSYGYEIEQKHGSFPGSGAGAAFNEYRTLFSTERDCRIAALEFLKDQMLTRGYRPEGLNIDAVVSTIDAEIKDTSVFTDH